MNEVKQLRSEIADILEAMNEKTSNESDSLIEIIKNLKSIVDVQNAEIRHLTKLIESQGEIVTNQQRALEALQTAVSLQQEQISTLLRGQARLVEANPLGATPEYLQKEDEKFADVPR